MGRSSPVLKGTQPPIFGPCLLSPNGWMDEDGTWYGSRPWQRPHCVRREPSSPPPAKGAQQPPRLLVHVYCSHGRPSQLLLSSCTNGRPERFARCYRTVVCPVCPVLSATLVYCGQTVGSIKRPLGMELCLGPGHSVLDGDPTPLPKGGTALQFSAHFCCGQRAEWMKMPLGWVQVGTK